MPEVQKSSQVLAGETTQRFIEFIMMQAQQAALFLGRLPNPQTGKPEPNLDVARMLIDQLEMIREKTRGNLTNEEAEILGSILSDLQLGFVQAIKAKTGGPAAPAASTAHAPHPEAAPPTPEAPKAAEPAAPPAPEEPENKKRFSKSYGEV